MSDGHGTYGGYQQHRKNDEPACPPCVDALNAYMAAYRRRPGPKARRRTYAAARTRALTRLAREHPARFYELYTEERATP